MPDNTDSIELQLFTNDCEVGITGPRQGGEVAAPEQSVDTHSPKTEAADTELTGEGNTIVDTVTHRSSAASGGLTHVHPTQCEPFLGAPRAGTEFLDNRDGDLAANIASNGVLEPIVIWRAGEKYRVLSGNRRVAVVKHLREIGTTVVLPARIFEGDEIAALALAHACNQGREKPTAMEQAKSIAWAIKNLGRSQIEISRALGLDEAKVSRLLTLANLPHFIKDVATDANSLSENFAALLQGALRQPDQVSLMKARAEELSARNLTLGGPQLARHLLDGAISPGVREIADEAGKVIGRLSSDRHGAIQLKVSTAYLQPDAPLKTIVDALAFSIYDIMKDERQKER